MYFKINIEFALIELLCKNYQNYSSLRNKLRLDVVTTCLPVIFTMWEMELGGMWSQASTDEELARPSLKVQVGAVVDAWNILPTGRWR
jgi:hypothetical protein